MKVVRYVVAVLLAFTAIGAVAQEVSRPNIVKLNLLSAASGTVSVEYERVLMGKFSLNGNLAFYPRQPLPFKSIMNKLTDNSSVIEAADMSVFSGALEGRYYVNKKNVLEGVYVAPFVKFSESKANTEVPYGQSSAKEYLPLVGSFHTVTGGVALGVQWVFANKMTLDWRIIGVGYGASRGFLEGRRELTTSNQKEIRDQLEKLEGKLPLVKLKSSVSNDGVQTTINGPWLGLRTGLSLGYNF